MARLAEMNIRPGNEVIGVIAHKDVPWGNNGKHVRVATSLDDPDGTITATIYRIINNPHPQVRDKMGEKLAVVASTDLTRKRGTIVEVPGSFRNFVHPTNSDERVAEALRRRNLSISTIATPGNAQRTIKIVNLRES